MCQRGRGELENYPFQSKCRNGEGLESGGVPLRGNDEEKHRDKIPSHGREKKTQKGNRQLLNFTEDEKGGRPRKKE